MKVKWAKGALFNLNAIAQFIEQDNPTRAKSFVLEIREKTRLLLEFPAVGRSGRVSGTRELVAHKNYLIIYRIKDQDVQILRVHHVAQKLPNQLE